MRDRYLRLLLVFALATAAAAQLPPGSGGTASQVDPAEVALAEAVYVDEFLRDPSAAARLYEQVLEGSTVKRDARQEAQWRLARCLRRLNQPAEARALLTALLLDATLPDRIRQHAEAELRDVPRADPARLLAQDTLIYAEAPQPGILLERVLTLLRKTELDQYAHAALLQPLRGTGLMDLRGFWNESLQAELRKLDAAGLGWGNFRFRSRPEGVEALADAVFVLHTGGSIATAGLLEGIVKGLFTPREQVGDVRFYQPAGMPAAPNFTVADGLFIACSTQADGLTALGRHRGETAPASLAGAPRFLRRPSGWPEADALFFYVDWHGLLDRLRASLSPPQRDLFEREIEHLALRHVGPLYGSLGLREDALEVEIVADTRRADTALARLLRSEPLEPGWAAWVPQAAILALVSRSERGAERWRAFEALLIEAAALDAAYGGAADNSTTQPTAFLDNLRAFERGSGLRIAEDVCSAIESVVLVALPPHPDDSQQLPQWVAVLELDDPERWLDRIERGLGRRLFGEAADQPFRAVTVDTPIGPVESLMTPGLMKALAWQICDGHVVFGLGVEAVVSYRQTLAAQVRPLVRPDEPLSKLVRVRLVEFLELVLGWAPPDAAGLQLPPLTLTVVETPDRIHFRLDQPRLADTLRALLPFWATLEPSAAASAGR